MKKYIIVAIGAGFVHRMTVRYADPIVADHAARRFAATNRGIIFRVEETRY